jgi:hypothetical protein
MLNRHFPWVRALVTIAPMTAQPTADLINRASDGRLRATVYWPTADGPQPQRVAHRLSTRVQPAPWKLGVMQLARAVVLGLVALLPPAAQAAGDTLRPSGMPPALVQAQKIRAQINARYLARRGPDLAVTEASSTGVIESFTLTTGTDGLRVVSADGGIYFALCPRHASCPHPVRGSGRPAAAFLPRRQALELALRTFLETPADVVAVSLPTTRFVLFIVERTDLEREVDMPTLMKRLAGNPTIAVDASLRRSVNQLTYSRIFLPLGLQSTPTGGDTMPAIRLWPTS